MRRVRVSPAPCPVPGEFRTMDNVCWADSIPLLVVSVAIALSEQEQWIRAAGSEAEFSR